MSKQIIQTEQAPVAVGPYSQGVRTGNLLFTAGQVPLDPDTGQMVEGDIRVQTDRVMQNLKAVLAAAAASFDDVVKTTVFLADIEDYAGMNEVYGHYLSSPYPARSAFQVGSLPLGAKVEIEMVVQISD